MYQSHELLQDFVPFMFQCEETRKLYSDKMESNDFNLYEMFFYLASKVHT